MPTFRDLLPGPTQFRCRCCELDTVATGVAWLSLIGSILGVVLGIAATIVGTVGLFQTPRNELHLVIIFLAGVIAGPCILFMCGIKLAVSSILLHGLYNERPRLFIPWLVHSTIELGLLSLSWIIFHCVQPIKGIALIATYVTIGHIIFGWLLIYIVNRYRKQLKDGIPQTINNFPLLNSTNC